MNKQLGGKNKPVFDKFDKSNKAKASAPVNKFLVLDSDSEEDQDEKINMECKPVSKSNETVHTGQTVKTVENNFFQKFGNGNSNEQTKFNKTNVVENVTNTTAEKASIPTVSSFSKFENISGWQSAPGKKKYNGRDNSRSRIDSEKFYSRDESGKKEDGPNEKQLYIENSEVDYGNKLYLNSKWTVWVHKSECKTWKESDYSLAYEIDSIGTVLRFFNSFHLYDKHNFQFFIMRNKIKPIWEDNENRKGFICSFKFDCPYKPGRIDVGTDGMYIACLLVMNETFIANNIDINGISYSIKNKSVLIKMWNRNGGLDLAGYEEKMRQSLFVEKMESLLRSNSKGYSKNPDRLVSIQCKLIEPEYES